MPSRATCPHCNTAFTPDAGAHLDDCPKCGRAVEVQPSPAQSNSDIGPRPEITPAPPLPRSAHAFECPLSHPLGKICTCGAEKPAPQPAPAPLPVEAGNALSRMEECAESGEFSMRHFEDIGTVVESYRLLHAHLSYLTRRLAEVEADAENATYLLGRASPLAVKAIARAEAAEARVRELEKKAKGLESAMAGEKAAREHDRSVRWALPETMEAGCPDDIRALGWAVAVHNDYKLHGVKHTFWLFTKGDRNMKGEGLTDAEALNEVRAALAASEASA